MLPTKIIFSQANERKNEEQMKCDYYYFLWRQMHEKTKKEDEFIMQPCANTPISIHRRIGKLEMTGHTIGRRRKCNKQN